MTDDTQKVPADSHTSVAPATFGDPVPTTPAPEVYRVSVKIPPFWPEEPEIWFAQIEGQFNLSKITVDETKFNYVISHLDQQNCKEVKDLIISPPTNNKYQKLKEELIKRLTASKDKKIKQLLMHEQLGERKPSQFLRHLRDLGGPTLSEDLLLTIWRSRLPNNIQTVIAVQPDASVDLLADLADRVQDIAPATPQVASTSSDSPGSSLIELKNEIAELRKQIQDFKFNPGRSRTPYRSGPNQRQRSKSTRRSSSSYQRFPLCWYHAKFGKNATRCDEPCDFPSENLPGSQ
ncbi:uncharacterized protein LOC134740921 [Cydia strobilella]|uniref:uncharacterized protein LOC134740921 n=1 Tax=Cydia strobilella TaxID=1100964 RepID=UPI00300748A6